MYVFINNEPVQVDIASDILGIDKQQLIDAGHIVDKPTDQSPFNYSQRTMSDIYNEVLEDNEFDHEHYNNRFDELY